MIGGRSALLAASSGNPYGNWTGNYSDVSLLLRNVTPSGTLVPFDESPTPKTITTVGNASVSTAIAKWNRGSGGSSLAFDGSTVYLTAASPNLSGDWTVETWIYPMSVAVQQTIFNFNAGSQFGINIWINPSGQLVVDDGATAQAAFTSQQLLANQWQHVAISRLSGTTRGFINGNLAGSHTFTPATTRSISVGRFNASPFYYMNANLDDARVTVGVARYETGTGANAGKMVFTGTNTLALPTAELPANITDDLSYNSVSLLLRNGTPSGTLVPFDESPTPKTITTYGTAGISTTTFKYGGSALSLPGNASSYFTAPSNAFVATNAEAFTIEFWAYVVATTSGFVISNYTGSGFGFGISVASGGIGATLVGGGEQMSGGAPVLNSWNHVALSGTPVSPGLMLFLNGSKQGPTYAGSVSLGSTTVVVTIGRLGNTAASPFNSLIDDLRITKGVARYVKDFLPPPAQLPAI